MRVLRAALVAGSVAGVLTGCVTQTAALKEPLGMKLRLVASKAANADSRGRGTPLLVRVYELRNQAAFSEADFFSLQDNDKKTLGDDLLTREEFVLLPGTSREIQRDSRPDAKALGFFAGYRNLDGTVWRQVYVLPAAADAAWYRLFKAKKAVDLTIRFEPKNMVISHSD